VQRSGARRCLTVVDGISTRIRVRGPVLPAIAGLLVAAWIAGGQPRKQSAPPSSAHCCTARASEPRPARPPDTGPVRGCEHQDLRLVQRRNRGVNSGQYLAGFQITDTAPDPCRVRGFSRLTLMAADRRVLPFRYRAAPEFVGSARNVLLRHGQRAGFQIVVWVCASSGPIVVRAARIELPGVTPSFTLPIRDRSVTYCTHARPDTIDILPLSRY
jgi:hypothetical protein